MGLGKTIQIIALMVVNQRDLGRPLAKRNLDDEGEDDEPQANEKHSAKLKIRAKSVGYSKTTLIIAPASLLRQWREEIETKCQDGLLRVHIHHGKDKIKSVKCLRRYDVILTSYQTLTAEFPTKLNTNDLSDWLPEMGCASSSLTEPAF